MKRVRGVFPEAVEASIWRMAVVIWERSLGGVFPPKPFEECVALAATHHVAALDAISKGLPVPQTDVVLVPAEGRIGFDQPA